MKGRFLKLRCELDGMGGVEGGSRDEMMGRRVVGGGGGAWMCEIGIGESDFTLVGREGLVYCKCRIWG